MASNWLRLNPPQPMPEMREKQGCQMLSGIGHSNCWTAYRITEEDPAYAWDGGKGKDANMLSDAFQTLVNKILADTVRTLADRMT